MQITGRRYETAAPVIVETAGGVVKQVRPLPADAAAGPLPWIAPGFVDLQVNGYGGQEFTDPKLTVERVEKISLGMDSCGVTKYCPTATTQSFEVLEHSLRTIWQACESRSSVAARVAGIHLEGPYISCEDGPRGAHPREHCRPPDWDEFQRLQEAAGGSIRILTLSPEYDGAAAFISRVVESGVIVAIGHTGATPEQIRAAVDAGAAMSTHLGNGAHGQIRRHPNYIWSQLADDRLTASLIVDGHHLPPEVVKVFVRALPCDRRVLVSDITGMGGMPPGRYDTSLGAVEVLDDGRLVVAGQRQYLAGAALPIGVGVANVMRFAGVDLPTAVRMASIGPAGIVETCSGGFTPGSPPDFVLFDIERDDAGLPVALYVRQTILNGETVFDGYE
ncbi:MAG: amidohydrolase family protein [Planctomycetes bacterium]|nr:amidohydrolase family protein [Planctomycetota bacterium]